MPGNSVTSKGPLQTLTINDWTLGIQNQAFMTLSGTTPFTRTPQPQTNPLTNPQITSSAYTYGCMALPNGGLLLGPTVFSVTSPYFTFPSGAANSVITGVMVGQQGSPFVNATYTASGPTVDYGLWQNATSLFQTGVGANFFPLDWPAFPFLTILYDSDSPFLAAVYTGPPDSGASNVTYFSDISLNGNLTTGGARAGWAIPANGRVWFNEAIISGLLQGIYNTISYTDPSIPTSVGGTGTNLTIGTQETLIDYDDPASFGAWGTITSGETMLIKNTMGGVLVTGDIYNPNISRAPAVQGTNGMVGQACLSPLGLVYRSYANGVWVWNGGANATKLSSQLDDSIWPENNSSYYQSVAPKSSFAPTPLSYPFFNVQYINNNLLFDGGLIYSVAMNSWWRLPPYATENVPGAIFAPCFYLPSYQSVIQFSAVYASNGPVLTTNTAQLTNYAFDVTDGNYEFVPPAGYYGSYWESNVIQPTKSIIEVQAVYILMQGTGTLTVSCVGVGGQALSAKTVNVSSNTGYKQIKITTDFETDGLILQVGWTNATGSSNNTPIIDSIQIDYVERFPVEVAN